MSINAPLLEAAEGEDVRGEEDEVPQRMTDTRRHQTNYGRLCMLIIREGTKRLRLYVKQRQPDYTHLSDLLCEPAIKSIFDKLWKSRKLTDHQYKILYPDDGGKLNEDDVDISLWVILARHLVDSGHDNVRWDKAPGPDDDLQPHHILRLRSARNELLHVPKNEVHDAEFYELWGRICRSLRKLGSTEQDLQEMRTCDLDPDTTKMVSLELQCEAMKDLKKTMEREATTKRWLLCVFICGLVIVCMVPFVIMITLYTKELSCSKSIQPIPTGNAWIEYMPRSGWAARDPRKDAMFTFHGPVDYLVVDQTDLVGGCTTHDECCAAARATQDIYMVGPRFGFNDIAYSYLIGGDGVVYEGRADVYIPATLRWRNKNLMSLAFIGYFKDNSPSQPALHAAYFLIQHLVDKGNLAPNATVLGLCQMDGDRFPNSPGLAILDAMRGWCGPHWAWRPINSTHCEGFGNQTCEG